MKRFWVGLCLLGVMVWPCACGAALVREMNLEDLCGSAGRIFAGTCTAVTETVDEATGRGEIVYDFKPFRILKGPRRERISFTMSRTVVRHGRAPLIRQGDSVVLFLYPKSELGFTSPVGLGQGRFFILESEAGKTVVNDSNNKNLFTGMKADAYAVRTADGTAFTPGAKGPIGYDTFLSLVESVLK